MIALLLMAAAVASAAPKSADDTAKPVFDARILAAHNAERERVGVLPLEWSDGLARDALVWAAYLAQTNRFEHAPEGREPQGENLWMGTRKAYKPEEMVGMWVDEKKMYQPRRFPDVSTTGNWTEVGHYTQLIWSRTRKVGCGVASSTEWDVLVCRYSPPGNWMGEYAALPLPTPKGAPAKGQK